MDGVGGQQFFELIDTKKEMNKNFLIVTIVFGSMSLLLLIHHFWKHSWKPHYISNKWERLFQFENIYNFRFTHEKFVLLFALISIGFGIAYGLSD